MYQTCGAKYEESFAKASEHERFRQERTRAAQEDQRPPGD